MESHLVLPGALRVRTWCIQSYGVHSQVALNMTRTNLKSVWQFLRVVNAMRASFALLNPFVLNTLKIWAGSKVCSIILLLVRESDLVLQKFPWYTQMLTLDECILIKSASPKYFANSVSYLCTEVSSCQNKTDEYESVPIHLRQRRIFSIEILIDGND